MNKNVSAILEGLSQSRTNEDISGDPFIVDYDMSKMYGVGIYPFTAKSSSPKFFKTQSEAEKYATKFLKSLKNKRGNIPNSQRRCEIEYGGKVIKTITYQDVCGL